MDVSVVSPEQAVWEGEADMVIARSTEGEFGIMRGHIPFLAALVPGRVTIVTGSDREEFFVPGGFLEASAQAVTSSAHAPAPRGRTPARARRRGRSRRGDAASGDGARGDRREPGVTFGLAGLFRR